MTNTNIFSFIGTDPCTAAQLQEQNLWYIGATVIGVVSIFLAKRLFIKLQKSKLRPLVRDLLSVVFVIVYIIFLGLLVLFSKLPTAFCQ